MQADTYTDIDTHTDKETRKQAYTETQSMHTEKGTDKQIQRQTAIHVETYARRHTHREMKKR